MSLYPVVGLTVWENGQRFMCEDSKWRQCPLEHLCDRTGWVVLSMDVHCQQILLILCDIFG